MARPRNTEERRKQIVAGFKTVLARVGYEKATISKIAQESELSTGLIHYHFPSKLAIFVELLSALESGLQERQRQMTEGVNCPEERLVAFLKARLLKGPGEDPEAVACWVAIGAEAMRHEKVAESYRRTICLQREQLVELLTRVDKDCQAHTLSSAILAAIEGYYQLAATVPELVPEGQAFWAVKSMVEGLLNRSLPS